jgi:hypothetical protein
VQYPNKSKISMILSYASSKQDVDIIDLRKSRTLNRNLMRSAVEVTYPGKDKWVNGKMKPGEIYNRKFIPNTAFVEEPTAEAGTCLNEPEAFTHKRCRKTLQWSGEAVSTREEIHNTKTIAAKKAQKMRMFKTIILPLFDEKQRDYNAMDLYKTPLGAACVWIAERYDNYVTKLAKSKETHVAVKAATAISARQRARLTAQTVK